METIANICKGTENLGNNQTDLKLNAFEVGENLVAFLVPHFANFVITNYTITEDEVVLTLKSKSTCACCDRCHIETHHTRGWQKRKVTMPPLGGKRFTLILYMRKFYCKADGHFFTEQQPDWLNKYARFSIDCTRLMNQVHLQMSSVSASRILSDMGIHCCPNTCINHLKNIKLAPDRTATNIGIDDFAKRKGHSYGSAIVNHDTGQVLELIDSRDSEKVAEVLSLYHHVSTITRDRGKCYINAIKKALPAATVVADKFHIMENLTKALFPQVQSRFLHERKRLLDKSEIGPKPPVLDQSWVLQGIYASLDSMSKDVEKAKTFVCLFFFQHGNNCIWCIEYAADWRIPSSNGSCILECLYAANWRGADDVYPYYGWHLPRDDQDKKLEVYQAASDDFYAHCIRGQCVFNCGSSVCTSDCWR